jgi:hypothetical protein
MRMTTAEAELSPPQGLLDSPLFNATMEIVMNRILISAATLTLALAVTACSGAQPPTTGTENTGGETTATAGAPEGWGAPSTWVFPAEQGISPSMFVDKVDNPYWPLAPGTKWSYEASTDEGTETIEVTVLSETKEIMGITCAVVHDAVKRNGELIEDTYDWYAQDTDGNVWYMGEDSKEYEGGKVVSTAGSWEGGVNGAQPGIKVWAQPHVGGPPYYQEYLKGEAEDLGKDLRTDGVAETPVAAYDGLLVVEEWTPLDPEFIERKYYKAGVGTVKEEMIRGGKEVVLLTEFVQP